MKPSSLDSDASCWMAELAPAETAPSLHGEISADVAVIGAGLTGLSTAWHLASSSPDLRIVVLEASRVGGGATGRSGGQVLNGINGIEPGDAVSARRVRAATMAGIAIVEELSHQSSIATGFRRDGAVEVTTTARSAEAAGRRVEQARAWGLPLRWLDAASTGMRGVTGAVFDPDAACMNPAALVRGLVRPLASRGVTVYENTRVTRIREGHRVRISTGDGAVNAAAVVLAANAWTPTLGYFRGRVLALHSRVVATAPLPAHCWEKFGSAQRAGFSDDLDRIAYGCRTPGGRLLFGGGGNDAYCYRFGGSAEDLPFSQRGFEAIESKLAAYFPGLGSSGDGGVVERRWSGPLAVTFDRVCSMGVIGEQRNVYYALGYSGHGLALAALAGRVLADLHAGNHDDWRDLPFYQRRLLWIPPEPLRWAGYQAYTMFTGRSPRRR